MIRYTPSNQLSIEEFKTPFQLHLDSQNRWVKLAAALPWDSLAQVYHRCMSADKGAPSVDARIVIGSLIIKHKLKLDDREVVETIRENMYLQYFLGLSSYQPEPLFDRSLFTAFRYRLGADKFDEMSQELIARALGITDPAEKAASAEKQSEDEPEPPAANTSAELPDQERAAVDTKREGSLKLDATVADQLIKYPTDLDLLSQSREESERLIDVLCEHLRLSKKPRTYRRNARRDYLLAAKKKKKSRKEIRKAIGKQLNYLKRNIKSVEQLLNSCSGIPFNRRDYKLWLVIQHVYLQQLQMHKDRSHSCDNRIVSIYQPHVRPIVRGKAKSGVEFGAKLGVSEHRGYVRLHTLSWEAYNESSDLVGQVEAYRALHGHYPEVVIADAIYGTRANRKWLKDNNIRYSGKPLGRPSKESQTAAQKRAFKKEQGQRNHVEGKFGQAKNGYNLNRVRATTSKTSESWVACILFVMNLVRFSKDLFLSLYCWLPQLILTADRSNTRLFAHEMGLQQGWKVRPAYI